MNKNYLKIGLIGLCVVLVYIPTFIWMWGRWFAEESYYSHGILVPFVSVFLILFRKDELKGIKPQVFKPGIFLIIGALLIHLVSAWMKVYFTSGFSLVLLVFGLVLYLLGPVFFRKLFYPILFLLFMVPIPMVLVADLTVKMKLFAADCSTLLLNQIGIPAVREGSIIRTASSYMVVAAPCSGLRSLISLLALGSLVAYFMNVKRIKKWALLIVSMPIALSANIFRVTLLTAVNEIYGEEFAAGWFHDFSGFMLFFVALTGLMIAKKALE